MNNFNCRECGERDPFKFNPSKMELCEMCSAYARLKEPEEAAKWNCKTCGETEPLAFYGRRTTKCKACVCREKVAKKSEHAELDIALFEADQKLRSGKESP